MSREREDEERPCLHCMMVELIDDFFAKYPATAASDTVDTGEADEVIDAIAKTVAELTSQQDGVIRTASHRAFDAADNAVRRRISPGRGGLRSRVSRETLRAVRVEWSPETNSTPPPCWTGRGVIWRCKGPLQKYRRPQNRDLTFLNGLTVGTSPPLLWLAGYQLAGSLLRPRRTNVCRQSGCSMSSRRRVGKRRSSVLIAISPSRRASCAPTQ